MTSENSYPGKWSEMGRTVYKLLNHPRTPINLLSSIDDVKKEALQRVDRVFASWNQLNRILLQYEDVLQKRWIKKNQEQRKKVLQDAWPNIPANHRPDFQALTLESPAQRLAGTRFRNEYLFPYINLEDLLKPQNLLLFLHSRGHNLPHTFAGFDPRSQELGRHCSAIQPLYLEG